MLKFTQTWEATSWGLATHYQWRGDVYPKSAHPTYGGTDCILPLRQVPNPPEGSQK